MKLEMPVITRRGRRYRFAKAVKFWECHASNGMFGPTRHDGRTRQTCGHKHKSEAAAKKCSARLSRSKPHKRRRYIPLETHRVLYVAET